MPSLEELKSFLAQRSVRFVEQPIQNGVQLKCTTGEIICHYDRRGSIVVQGKSTSLSQAVTSWAKGDDPGSIAAGVGSAASASAAGLQRDIFVVYGHDTPAREKLELLIHKMGLNPIVLANLIPDGDTVIEKLEKYLVANSDIGYACVLLTPDDEGNSAGSSGSVQYRARQNFILELGMVLARLGRDRVAIFRKKEVEEPSDIAGLLYIPFEERPDEEASILFRSLQAHGYFAGCLLMPRP